MSLIIPCNLQKTNQLLSYWSGCGIAIKRGGGFGMSLRKAVLVIALCTALAVLAGLNLTNLQNVAGAVASAVWGS
jgi:hypothetical protein